MSDSLLEHDLVRNTTFGDLPHTRHLCLRCGAESVGAKPATPCPGPPSAPSIDPEHARCRHCGKRIVKTHYAWGPEWTHQHAGASFQDGQHDYCHVTRAEPADLDVHKWLCSACGARGECATPEVAAAALAEHRRTSTCPGAAL